MVIVYVCYHCGCCTLFMLFKHIHQRLDRQLLTISQQFNCQSIDRLYAFQLMQNRYNVFDSCSLLIHYHVNSNELESKMKWRKEKREREISEKKKQKRGEITHKHKMRRSQSSTGFNVAWRKQSTHWLNAQTWKY